ncbi:retinol-binding protein pinta-like [Sitophilus oryzae]|uniref:Retinol-binding protein pinta-like n=1 Tax=Sitophilus oryzae TaxID=7048 RepID=A0A6J2Y3V0_SITOR|nr:retinol-binding protein pinta-like [Sitophilus oryzae]
MSNAAEVYLSTLDDQTLRYVIDTLNESDENREKCLEEIRAWLRGDAAWLNARTETKHILPFLRGCKFNIEKTKTKMTNYYTMRRDRPEWFTNRNPLLPVLQELIRLGIFVPLKHHHENQSVVLVRTAAHDPKKHQWNDIFKAGMMILDVMCMENEKAQIYGVIAIFDMTGIGFAHYRTMTPSLMKNAVFSWQNYHVRPKKLEFVNSPTYINVALNIIKSFMTEKMRGRVKVHFGGVCKAQEVVNRDILPPEYGGEGESMAKLGEFWLDKLVQYKAWFADDERYKAE